MAKLYPISTAHNHDEIYAKIGEGGGGVTDHGLLTGLEDNDHPQYLLAASGKAADSDKLDGLDSTDFVLASGLGTSTAYTPIWTASTSNPTLGDGTLQGRYIQVGKLVVVFITFIFGSTSSFGVGNHFFSLPFAAQSSGGGLFDGFARFRKSGVANYFRIAGVSTLLSSTEITLFSSLTGNDNNWTPTSPFSMGVNDSLVIQLMYERT